MRRDMSIWGPANGGQIYCRQMPIFHVTQHISSSEIECNELSTESSRARQQHEQSAAYLVVIISSLIA